MPEKKRFLGRLYRNRRKENKERELDEEREHARQVLEALPDVGTVIDIGIGPEGTSDLWDRYSGCQFVFVDPVIECKPATESLLRKDKRNVFVNKAVGMEPGKIAINIDRGLNRSSVLDQIKGPKSREPVERREVEMATLDEIVSTLSVDCPVGIKIDTEGYELQVLNGAANILRQTEFLILEVRYRKNFVGQYSVPDLMEKIIQSGFVPYDILGANKRRIDMCFIRKKEC